MKVPYAKKWRKEADKLRQIALEQIDGTPLDAQLAVVTLLRAVVDVALSPPPPPRPPS